VPPLDQQDQDQFCIVLGGKMSTLHDAYVQGAYRLCQETTRFPADHEAASTLHIRLKENIFKLVNSDTSENRADRYEILQALNRITERLFVISFDDYCQKHRQQEISPQEDKKEAITFVPPQLIADSCVQTQVTDIITEGHLPIIELTEQDYDFLISAKTYITTLLPQIENAGQAFNPAISPRDCVKVYTSLNEFSHAHKPLYNQELLDLKVNLQNLNVRVKEVTEAFKIFYQEAQRKGKNTSKALENLKGKFKFLQIDANTIHNSITFIIEKKNIPIKNTLLRDSL
jgi:hypothetical protein